jgi:LuxR family maltose regulon positive regulatory protein
MIGNDLTAGQHWLQVAERALAADQPVAAAADGGVRGWLAVCHCELNLAFGDNESAITGARAALAEMVETETAWWVLRLRSACDYQYTGEVSPTAEQALAGLIAAQAATRDGNLMSRLNGLTFLARLQALQGNLRAARQTYAQAASTWPPSMPVVNPAYLFGLADIHREQNEFDQAQELFTQGLDLTASLTMDADVLAMGYFGMARLKVAQGDGSSALQLLREFEMRARRGRYIAPWLTAIGAAQARVHLAVGHLPAASAWAEASGLSAAGDLNYLDEQACLTLVRVRIAQGRATDALALLERWLSDAEAKNRHGSAIQMLVLTALAWRAHGDPAKAHASLRRALALGEPEGYVRVFADEGPALVALLAEQPQSVYGRRLLAASGQPMPDPAIAAEPVAPAGEPLRPRELEVLRLIATGLSNQEIASQLVLGRGTVKTHVNNLFRKLDVTSRTQAIARARQLGWLRD